MILLILAIFCFLLSILLLVWQKILAGNTRLVREKNIFKNPRFAFLIPARDESKVIEDLLKSIEMQSRKVLMEDVYVIVETRNDKTVTICKKYGACVVVRKRLQEKSKGYALAEAVEFIVSSKKNYDAYFIFDADNILDENYVKEMEKDYLAGYAISTGYRNYKNADESVVACASGVIYTFINEWINQSNMKKQKSLMLSGTGFYIHGDYINNWQTYPFHSLCEDVELSYYATRYGLSMHYNTNAIFYDEQPVLMRDSIKQRTRWVWGYFVNWFKNIPKLWELRRQNVFNKCSIYDMILGILPVILLVLSIFLLGIFLLIHQAYLWFVFELLICYFVLALGTFFIFYKENDKLRVSLKMKIKTIFYHPIFLSTYLYVVFLVLFKKNIAWDKIEHGK